MKLKTKIRAGKIRPNHNVTVHGTAASSFATGRIAAQAAETAEVVTLTASTSGAVVAILRAAAQARMPLREHKVLVGHYRNKRGDRIPCGCCEERRIL